VAVVPEVDTRGDNTKGAAIMDRALIPVAEVSNAEAISMLVGMHEAVLVEWARIIGEVVKRVVLRSKLLGSSEQDNRVWVEWVWEAWAVSIME
jgi:hypothetical protein